MANEKIMKIQGQQELADGIHYEVDVARPPIGEGGTGIVRYGVMVNENTGVRRDVAIKFLFNDLTENAVQRSRREASIRIVHENLVEMIAFVQVGDADLYGKGNMHYHVVSELLRGVMLLDMLNDEVPQEMYDKYPRIRDYYDMMRSNRNEFAKRIVKGVLSGIMALHDNGYVHRDIDPSNVMITDEGKIKLIDLGIAKRLRSSSSPGENVTVTGQFVGKAAYAAPELVRGDLAHQDQTTDIYAIGILLYQLVTGTLPFTGSIQEILEQQISKKLPLSRVKDKFIRSLVAKATEKRQGERFQSAAQFRAAFDEGAAPGGFSIPKEVVIAGLGVLGLALGVLLGFCI